MLGRQQLLLLAGCVALAPLAIDMYLPAMAALAADLGVSASEATQTVSVFLVGVAAGQAAAGPLSDRLGRRPMIVGGLGLFAVAALIAAFSEQLGILLAARFAQALGACAAMVSGRAVVRDLVGPAETARIFSLLALIAGVAPVLAPAAGAALAALGGWRTIFAAMAAFGAAVMIASIVRLPESRSAETAERARADHPLRTYANLASNRRLLAYLTPALFNSGAFFAYLASSPVILMDVYSLSAAEYSMALGINMVSLIAAQQMNRRLLKTQPLDAVLMKSACSSFILGLLFFVFAFTGWGGLGAFLGLLFFLVGSTAPIQANSMSGVLAAERYHTGSATALYGMATFAAGSLTGGLAAIFHDQGTTSISLLFGTCLSGTAISIWLLRHRRRAPAW